MDEPERLVYSTALNAAWIAEVLVAMFLGGRWWKWP
jgi:hypothetical protein